MNQYRFCFFLQLPSGEVRPGSHTITAPNATMAVYQFECLPLPYPRVGATTWTLIGPKLQRMPVPLQNLPRPLAA